MYEETVDKKKPAILLLLVVGTLFESVEEFEAAQQINTLLPEIKKTPENWPGLKESINDNNSIDVIVKKFGVSTSSVTRAIRRQGLQFPLSNRMRNKLGDNLELIVNDSTFAVA